MEYQNQEKFCLKVTGLKMFSLVFGIEECGHGKTHNNFELGKLILIRFNFLEMCLIFFSLSISKISDFPLNLVILNII